MIEFISHFDALKTNKNERFYVIKITQKKVRFHILFYLNSTYYRVTYVGVSEDGSFGDYN